MNKETFSRYGSLIAMVLVLAVMITFAAPFGNAIASGVNNFVNGFGSAMNGNAGGGGSGSSGIKLDAPTNLTLTNNQLSFDLVPNANQYILYVNDEVSATYATSPIDVSTYIETYGTPITFKLVASDSTGTYGNSPATEYVAAGDGKMVLKAGTYRLNDVLTETTSISQDVNFLLSAEGSSDEPFEITNIRTLIEEEYIDPDTVEFFAVRCITAEGEDVVLYINPVPNESLYQTLYPDGWIGGQKFSIDIPTDTEVDDTFGSWFISNTNYNEVNGGTGDEDSVLGLRRFKESVNDAFTELLSEKNIDNIFNDYGFTIAPLQSADGSVTIAALSCVGYNENQNEQGVVMVIEGVGVKGYLSLADFNEIFPAPFNILSTSNATVDEWLLANTEPVEEEETCVIKAGAYRFNDVLDFSNVPQNIIHLGYSYNDYYYAILNANNFETDAGTYNGVFFGVSDTTVLEPLWGSGTVDTLNYDGWIFDEQIIQTIPEDAEVSAEFYEWFTANTKRVIEVDELPTEDIDTSAIYKVNELVEDTDTSTLVGTWVFSETISPLSTSIYDVQFTTQYLSSGVVSEFSQIKFVSYPSKTMYYVTSSGNSATAYYSTNTWAYEEMRTITILSEPTNSTFITWLKANATKEPVYTTVEKYYQYVDGAWVER